MNIAWEKYKSNNDNITYILDKINIFFLNGTLFN